MVILIDEYDKPMLNSLDDSETNKQIIRQLKAFYGNLKSCDAYIKFAMLTGVARFSRVSVFSDLNNLKDISLAEDYNSICGISESELLEYFTQPIEWFANRRRVSFDDMCDLLRRKYDGYNFSNPEFTDCVYNPFSILNCFDQKRLDNYWFDTGTPSFLIKALLKEGADISSFADDIDVKAEQLKGINTPLTSPTATLYQSGYLTIKSYDEDTNSYTIGLPNEEVAAGFNNLAYMAYTPKNTEEFDVIRFEESVRRGDPEGFMRRLKALIANVPHEQMRDSEAAYHNIVYLLFLLLGYRVRTECHINNGVTDLVVATEKYAFVFEFKFNSSVTKGMMQINRRKYDMPYQSGDRTVYKIAVNFSAKERNITGWQISQ